MRDIRLFTIFILLISISLTTLASTRQKGTASWYDEKSCKREGTSGIWTASGERFNEMDLTCASWDYVFGTRLKVTNLENNKSVIVRVNDRGPNKNLYKQGRIIDLSKGAFQQIANLDIGVISIKVEVCK